jgi:hypothetical protein
LWHIATELCHNMNTVDTTPDYSREICNALSNYMLYLLVILYAMAGIGQIRYQVTQDRL